MSSLSFFLDKLFRKQFLFLYAKFVLSSDETLCENFTLLDWSCIFKETLTMFDTNCTVYNLDCVSINALFFFILLIFLE